jgi:hypothetical protein
MKIDNQTAPKTVNPTREQMLQILVGDLINFASDEEIKQIFIDRKLLQVCFEEDTEVLS